jgi:hypothetical protein
LQRGERSDRLEWLEFLGISERRVGGFREIRFPNHSRFFMLLKRIKIAERIDSIEPREAKEKIFQAASGI